VGLVLISNDPFVVLVLDCVGEDEVATVYS